VPAASTFATKAEADRWLAHKRSELDRGAVIDERVGAQPLAHWWPGYLKSLSGLKSSTVNSYEIAWRLRVQPKFGSTPVRRIRVSQVEDWIAELSAEGLSASKVLEAYGILKRLLDRAVRDRALPHNPCGNRSTRLPRHTAKDRPVLSPVEVDELASAMKHPLDGTLVRVLAYGGCGSAKRSRSYITTSTRHRTRSECIAASVTHRAISRSETQRPTPHGRSLSPDRWPAN